MLPASVEVNANVADVLADRSGRPGGDRRVGRDGIDDPRAARRRRVHVPDRVGRAHVEGVGAVGQPRVAVRVAAPARIERAPSRLHWNVLPASLEVNVNVAEVLATVPDGPAVIVVVGRHRVDGPRAGGGRRIGVPGAVDRAHTERVGALGQARVAGRARAERRAVQAALERAARLIRVNVNAADVLATVPAGPLVIVVSGAKVSTVHVRLAGVASVFPAPSVARTLKVCAPWASPV